MGAIEYTRGFLGQNYGSILTVGKVLLHRESIERGLECTTSDKDKPIGYFSSAFMSLAQRAEWIATIDPNNGKVIIAKYKCPYFAFSPRTTSVQSSSESLCLLGARVRAAVAQVPTGLRPYSWAAVTEWPCPRVYHNLTSSSVRLLFPDHLHSV